MGVRARCGDGFNCRLDSCEQTNLDKWKTGTHTRIQESKKNETLLTIQLISTDSRDPFDLFVTIHRSNFTWRDFAALFNFFLRRFLLSHTATALLTSISLDSVSLLLCFWCGCHSSSSFPSYLSFTKIS